jgi:hypothetical protein
LGSVAQRCDCDYGRADSSVLALLDDKKEYGKQRLWGQFGFGLAGCCVGPLLMSKRFGGYKAAFMAHAMISVPTLLIMMRFQPKPQKKESPRFKEGLVLLARNPDAVIFFTMGQSDSQAIRCANKTHTFRCLAMPVVA